MLVIKTNEYNSKRYSKPYLAEIGEDGKVKTWFDWLGTQGYDGEFRIEFKNGVLMKGKKDYRSSKQTPLYLVVRNEEIILETYSKIEAIKKNEEEEL